MDGGVNDGGMTGLCTGQDVTIADVTKGAVVKGTSVTVKNVVTMSQKFLVSKSLAGTCLYGVFVSAPGLIETEPYSGILVVSKGNNATIPPGQTTSYCGKLSNRVAGDPVPGDAIPDDVKPGDVLNVTGTADSFLLNQCATEPNGSTVPQRQISFACNVTRTGTAAVPAPRAFTAATNVAALASPTNAAFHDQWGGVFVRVSNVKPSLQPDPNGGTIPVVVGPFGVIKLEGSNLEVGDKVYYRGYDNSICHDGPVYSDTNVAWSYIDGFSYMNFCTWGLQPNNRCKDFNPPSDDCNGLICP
jgi:hypothetical protein